MNWFQHRLGFKPEDALIGLLGTAFMVAYMIRAPVLDDWRANWRWVLWAPA
jgi:hypothetical protein